MKPRTTVYVAMNGLVKVADGINYRQERVTLASDPAVAKHPDAWRELGTVDDDGAAYIVMLGDAAVLPRLLDRIKPIVIEPAEAPVDDGPIPPRGSGMTRSEVLKYRREWQRDGLPSPWARAGVSKATYIRHRHKYGLVPWPEGYRRQLTP
jgi:hypothetical protein